MCGRQSTVVESFLSKESAGNESALLIVDQLLLITAGRRDADQFAIDGIANLDGGEFNLRSGAVRWLVSEGWGNVVVDVDVAAVSGSAPGAVADAHADRDLFVAAESAPVISATNAAGPFG